MTKYTRLTPEPIPLGDGIDPPSERIEESLPPPESEMLDCKKCGKRSSLYISNRIGNPSTPLDLCNTCFWENAFTVKYQENPLEFFKEDILKEKLISEIEYIIKKRNLIQREAAIIMETTQSHVSLLVNHKLNCFSLFRLIKFLNNLGQDVSISTQQAQDSKNRGIIQFSGQSTLPNNNIKDIPATPNDELQH